ncbi:MAG: alpha/beta hydrolase, partial [Bacteroidia bacterium]
MKKKYILLGLVALIIAVVAFGPRPKYTAIKAEKATISTALADLEGFVAQRESRVENIKPDNESRFYWADSVRKTPYAIVYLHGFSASPMEGAPIHREIAARY